MQRRRLLGGAAAVAFFIGGICVRFSWLADTDTPEIFGWVQGTVHGTGGSSLSNQWPETVYAYKFPFEDGVRVEIPPGDMVDNARAVYQEISGGILARWGKEYEETLFSKGMRFSDEGKVLKNKMLNAVVEQGGFVAAFTGISVTAGHDCLYEQSYPVLLNATMSRLFAATGVRFEAINVAMGNTRVSPYSFCVDAHAGIDADIVSWEMSMEVNQPKQPCDRPAEAVELFIRSASVLPRRPAVLILNAAPDQELCEPKKLATIAKRNRGYVGECNSGTSNKSLMSMYHRFGLHEMYMNELVPLYVCDDKRFSREDLFHVGKNFPNPMRWHPGPHAHELVADVLFMHYAHMFLGALDHLTAAKPRATSQQLRDETTLGKAMLRDALGLGNPTEVSGDGHDFVGAGRGGILPRPAWCKGWRFCEGAGNYRCADTYSPLAGREGSQLLDMVSDRTPVWNANKTVFVVQPKAGHWAVTLNEIKQPILEYMTAPAPEGMHKPIDMKWVLVGDRESGPIEFEFETKGRLRNAASGGMLDNKPMAIIDSRVVVCKGENVERLALDDEKGVRFMIDGKETSVVRSIQHHFMTEGMCVLLGAQVGVGRHTLTIEPLTVGSLLLSVSHVIYPA